MNWYLRFGIAVGGGVLACGVPLWPIPYKEVSMPGNPSGMVWLGLGFLVALGAGYLIRSSWRAPILAVALGFVLAVMGRVEVETSRDPTSHNLWPFEVFIAGGIGLVASVLGVAASRLLQRMTAGR